MKRLTVFLITLLASFVSPSSQACVSVTAKEPFSSCDYLCNYCAYVLDTSTNFAFTDDVCTVFQTGACDGKPVNGKTYTCCSL